MVGEHKFILDGVFAALVRGLGKRSSTNITHLRGRIELNLGEVRPDR